MAYARSFSFLAKFPESNKRIFPYLAAAVAAIIIETPQSSRLSGSVIRSPRAGGESDEYHQSKKQIAGWKEKKQKKKRDSKKERRRGSFKTLCGVSQQKPPVS